MLTLMSLSLFTSGLALRHVKGPREASAAERPEWILNEALNEARPHRDRLTLSLCEDSPLPLIASSPIDSCRPSPFLCDPAAQCVIPSHSVHTHLSTAF